MYGGPESAAMLSSPEMFNALDAGSTGSAAEYIQPTLNHALRVWWAFYWRTSIISGVLSIAAGYGLRQLYENTALPAVWIAWAGRISPYAFFYFIAIFVIRGLLQKRFKQFRIALCDQAITDGSKLVEPTFPRALRVWWMYSWRAAIYGLVALVIVSYPMGLTLGLFAPSPAVMGLFGLVLGIVIAAGVGLFVIYSNILDEDIGDFHVTLLPHERASSEAPQPSPAVVVPRG